MGNLFGKSSAKETAGKIVMFVTGSVLIVATALKIHPLLTELNLGRLFSTPSLS